MSAAIDTSDELLPSTPARAQTREGDTVDLAALNQAIRVIMVAVAERIPSAVSITEREVLVVGRCVSEVVDAARAQAVESREILGHVDENSGIATAIEKLATAMASFLGELSPVLDRQQSISTAAAANSAKIEEAGQKIESIALAANILNLNAQIEAARLGAIGEPFMIIASEMTSLTRQIEEANQLISELSSELGSRLPEIAKLSDGISRRCGAFSQDFESQVSNVRDAQGSMQQIVRDSLQSTEERAALMLRIGQDALSHLQFQDPVAQSLRQVQMGMAAVGAMVQAHAPAYDDAESGHAQTSDGHNPLHALAAQYGLTSPAKAAPAANAGGVEPGEDDEALDSGDVLLF